MAGGALALTAPTIGRAPAIVAITSVVLASSFASVDRRPGPTGRIDAGWVGLFGLVAAGAWWYQYGGLAVVAALLLLLAALAVASNAGTISILRIDAWAGTHLEGAGCYVGRATRMASASATHGTLATSRAASKAARRIAVSSRDRARVTTQELVARSRCGGERARRTVPVLWERWAAPVAIGTVIGAVSIPIWWALAGPDPRLQAQINDLPNHIVVSHEFQLWPPHTYSPHLMFAALLRLATIVFSDRAAATLVLAVAYGATGSVLYRIARRPADDREGLGAWGSLWLPMSFLLVESPALLRSAGAGTWDRPFLDPLGTAPQLWVLHTWSSPTSVLLLPFALALVSTIVELTWTARPDASRPRPATWKIASLTLFATVAKPPVTLVLIVAVPLTWLLSSARRSMPWRALTFGLLVPGATVVAVQTAFLASGVNPREQTTWRWDPFWLVDFAQLTRPIIWVPALLPIAATVVGGRRYLATTSIRLSLVGVSVAFVPTFLLRETGSHANHANLAWTMIFALILLELYSIDFLVREVADLAGRRREPTPAAIAALAVVGVLAVAAFCAGVFHYLVLTGIAHY